MLLSRAIYFPGELFNRACRSEAKIPNIFGMACSFVLKSEKSSDKSFSEQVDCYGVIYVWKQ